MRAIILYRPESEHRAQIETFVSDFQRQHHEGKLEVIDADNIEGVSLCTLYEIMQFPTILILSDDGSLIKEWQGETLPLMDELSYYIKS